MQANASDTVKCIGLDVGGVAVKGVLRDGDARSFAETPFEVWHDPTRLDQVIAELLDRLDPERTARVALTTTAELVDVFANKEDGVRTVVVAAERASERELVVWTTTGELLTPDDARERPLEVAAANWAATATLVARTVPDAVVVDVGSTTTDVIPVQGGRESALGRTDTARLLASELVYTGAQRTNAATIAPTVPVADIPCPVASELFAVSADVHLTLGHLTPEDCVHPFPDGGGATTEEAERRLARLVCADVEDLGEGGTEAIARHLHERQVTSIADAIRAVGQRIGGAPPVVALGSGRFLAVAAAAEAGLTVVPATDGWQGYAGVFAPAAALAVLGSEPAEVRAPA